jgi:hypothetical protein
MSNFRKALIFSAIPTILLAVTAIVLGYLNADYSSSPAGVLNKGLDRIGEACLVISIVLAGVAILASTVFAIIGKGDIAKGAGIGGGIGFVAFVIAFFILLGLYG